MPTWDKILEEANTYRPSALLEKYIKKLHQYRKNTVICYLSAFTITKAPAPSPFLSIIDQDIQGFMTCSKEVDKKELDLIIHTPGGDYEATKRIITYLKETYQKINVFIPHMAMSGGTMLACAADKIYMGPYSSLGPTDPQVYIKDRYVPVGAILQEFDKAFNEVVKEPKKAILWNERLKSISPGLIPSLESMEKNALIDLLRDRNCKNLNDNKIEKIANTLNKFNIHSSHGKGISLKEAQNLELNVENLRNDKKLEDIVLSIYHTSVVLFQQSSAYKIIINHKKRRYIMQFTPRK